jgi:hypothetical protein
VERETECLDVSFHEKGVEVVTCGMVTVTLMTTMMISFDRLEVGAITFTN